MRYKILAFIILLIHFVPTPLIANSSEPETIAPLADTYADYLEATEPHGDRDYLEVSDYASGLSVIVLMFDISDVHNLPSEAKLRLYCFDVPSPLVIGVFWCVNNTWNEENLTSVLLGKFNVTRPPESVVNVSIDTWYEWKVTDLVSMALEKNYERITLTLEVIPPSEGIALFASKDQPTQEMREYGPQLVFTYLEPEANPTNTIILVAFGLTVTGAIAFIAYKFSKRSTRKVRRGKSRVRSKSL